MALIVTATMMPLYLTTVTGFISTPDKGIPAPIAAVPLCSYICSLIYTLKGQAKLSQMFRSRIFPLTISILFTSVGSVPYVFLNQTSNDKWLVYPLACIQGVGMAMMLNTSTSLISDVVSKDSENSAIVYGFYSFADKMSNGFLLFFLVKDYAENATALKVIISVIPTMASIFTALLTWIGISLYQDKMARISLAVSARKM